MYNKEKANNKKRMAMVSRGGKCECCSYTFKTLGNANFHHIDSSTKRCNMASMWNTYSDKAIMEELNKCIMLCSNCHDELHDLFGKEVSSADTYAYINMMNDDSEVME